MKNQKSKILKLLFCLLFAVNSFAFTNYVWQGSASPAAPYDSWATAAHTIQPAIDYAVEGNVVLVTNGVYTLSDNIMLATNNVVLKSVNGAENSVIDGNFINNCIYLRGQSTVDSFLIRNGISSGSGGGILIFGNGTVLNCIFTNNVAQDVTYGGGAIYSFSGFISNCTVKANTAIKGGGLLLRGNSVVKDCVLEGNNADNGGAIYCNNSGEISNCIIKNNTADNGAGGYIIAGEAIFEENEIIGNIAVKDGGAFYVFNSGAKLVLKNVNVISNLAESTSAVANLGGGGVAVVLNAELNLINCLFDSNASSNFGGAISIYASQLSIDSDFSTFPALTQPPNRFFNNSAPNDRQGGAILITAESGASIKNAIFTNNYAGGFGGAVYVYDASTCDFVNIVVAHNNSMDSGDGIRAVQDSALRMAYCTVVDNDKYGVTTVGSDLTMTNCIVWAHGTTEVSSGENVQYSDIQGGYATGTNNIAFDPLFVDSANLNYQLTLGSPCKNTALDIGIMSDCIGETRPQLGGYDMGAYEFVPEPFYLSFIIYYVIFISRRKYKK
ncbi:MAG: hypothetical protein DRI44_09950 [Chlamydiae bacterium]|nr:MAG: hypothetical protein DRI44_09950 [Chlamydiota bacterium]